MKTLKDYTVGDVVFWKSYEGIKESGCGKIIDLWCTKVGGTYYATAKDYCGKVVCIGNRDLR